MNDPVGGRPDELPDVHPHDKPAEHPDDKPAEHPDDKPDEHPDDKPADRPALPEQVRARVVSLAADGLGVLAADEVPAALRPFAKFTPSRRAKLAATPIAAAIEHDPVFRQRVAERLRAALPQLAEALDAGTVPAAADPLDVAAAAYLLRPPGWTDLVAAAAGEVERAAARTVSAAAEQTVTRLRAELDGARAAARAETERLRGELESARKETDDLRRQLRQVREAARRAEAALRAAEVAAEAQRAAATTAAGSAEADLRRLRNRLAEAETALEASRRASREGRNLTEARVRLLLDTVLEAASGLRRELALPPSTSRPADAVDAVVPGAGRPGEVAQRGHAAEDPALLDQLLTLPQVHLVVDGYNVTKAGYGSLPLAEQRLRLLGGLAVLAAQSGAEITCVFDGAELQSPVVLATPRGVRVLFSRPGETADELVRRLVRAEPQGRAVVVVSSDREVADGVRAAGARPVPSALLLRRLARG